MLKYSSKQLTLNDVQAIETFGATVASKRNNIALPLATRCEKVLQKKLIGGGSKGNRKLQNNNESSESELDSESDNMPVQGQGMPMQGMPMQGQGMPVQGQGKGQSMGQVDPLMLNYSAPIINQENVLGYLKQLNAI